MNEKNINSSIYIFSPREWRMHDLGLKKTLQKRPGEKVSQQEELREKVRD